MSLQWNHKIFNTEPKGFEGLAMEIFRFQFANNPAYARYVSALGKNISTVSSLQEIPFLPISAFKTTEVKTGEFAPAMLFTSSGTTGTVASRHLIKDISLYEQSFTKGFERFYGRVSDWCILGLLPSYLERDGSSLVYMVNKLIQDSNHPYSGFYLYEWDKLKNVLEKLEAEKQPALLIGVSFALLDFMESHPVKLEHTVMMETGGMKGRRKEMIREELHERLKQASGLNVIHSEYGMTELLSQAYSKGNGIFYTPSWMKVMVRDEEDPLTVKTQGAGLINIIDLANIYSCSFIATDDAGKVQENGSFEIIGRMDGSDMRGCSLLLLG